MASVPPSEAAVRFRDGILDMIHGMLRDGVDHALDTLFAISDVVLNNRHCDGHTMARIRHILAQAFPESEEESTS